MRSVAKTIKELEAICQPYLLSDSKVYDIVRQGGDEEYAEYLSNAIKGIIESSQVKFRPLMGETGYKKYIKKLENCILTDKSYSIEDKALIFKDAAEGCLIGGFA